MIKVAFVIYRSWAYEILKNLAKKNKFVKIIIITSTKPEFKTKKIKFRFFKIKPTNSKLMYKILKNQKIDIIFFYGWSWIVSDSIVNNFLCICLHPSKLPLFRGGSPIQNQIFRGVINSAVTVFRIEKKVDQGPIFMQKKLSLKGDINKIFNNISKIGTIITLKLVDSFQKSNLKFYKQRGKASFYKRLTEKKNEMSINKLKNITYKKLFDYVRSLQPPYPGLRIIFKNKKIKILSIKKFEKKIRFKQKNDKYLELKDSYAKILRYKKVRH